MARRRASDLRNEPSGIASAVFDAAPVTVFDVASSPLVSARLASLVGAKSGAWVPLITEERVVGVLVLASTDGKRAFGRDELSLLQALASEAALALERLRSAAALSDALARERRAAEIMRRVRAELEPDDVVRVARDELRAALRARLDHGRRGRGRRAGRGGARRAAHRGGSDTSSRRCATRSTRRCVRPRCSPRTVAASRSRLPSCMPRKS